MSVERTVKEIHKHVAKITEQSIVHVHVYGQNDKNWWGGMFHTQSKTTRTAVWSSTKQTNTKKSRQTQHLNQLCRVKSFLWYTLKVRGPSGSHTAHYAVVCHFKHMFYSAYINVKYKLHLFRWLNVLKCQVKSLSHFSTSQHRIPNKQASWLCFQPLPSTLSKYFPLFHLPPLSFSSSSFSVFLC